MLYSEFISLIEHNHLDSCFYRSEQKRAKNGQIWSLNEHMSEELTPGPGDDRRQTEGTNDDRR